MLVAGWARRDITPAGPRFVAGYDDQARFCEGVADRLYARAVWLGEGDGRTEGNGRVGGGGDGPARWMLIHLDVIALEGSYVRAVKAELSQAFGLGPEQVMIACSHTHSGPGGLFRFEGEEAALEPSFAPYIGGYDPGYAESLRSAIVAVAGEALGRRVEVTASVAVKTAPPGLFANRRRPDGPVDLSVPVLRLDDAAAAPAAATATATAAATAAATGRPLVVIANVSCHPTVVGRSSRLISADFPGRVASRIESRTGRLAPAMAMVTTGAAGDVSTRFTRLATGFAECDRVSDALAEVILGERDGGGRTQQRPLEPRLSASSVKVRLPLKPVPDSRTCGRRVEAARAKLSRLVESGGPEPEIRSAETELEGETITLRRALLKEAGKARADAVETEVQRLTLGQTVLVGLPCELFSELGMRLKQRASPRPVVVTAYANGYVGYVPTAAAYGEAGYEVMTSVIRKGGGEQLVDEAARSID